MREARNISGAGGIDVGRLERELSAMWSQMSGAQREGVHASITRVCVLNLVAYAGPHDDRETLDEVLDEVTARHPCRALVIHADPAAREERLDAYVSTRCQFLKRGGKQICGEQVTIEAAGRVVERAASVVAPLLVPDVPVFLWWKDIPHDEDKLFARLAEMADRVVIDSAASDRPHADFLRLARTLGETRREARVSDVNWGRLTTWRTLVASFWDVPGYASHLERLSRVTVGYHPPTVAPAEVAPQAWLLVGWLASRLGWTFAPRPARLEDARVSFDLKTAGGRGVEVIFRSVEGVGDCGGRVASLELFAEESDARFHVEYRPELTKLETGARVGEEQSVGRVLAYEARSEGQRLAKELDFLTRDRIYTEAVLAAAPLIEALRDRVA